MLLKTMQKIREGVIGETVGFPYVLLMKFMWDYILTMIRTKVDTSEIDAKSFHKMLFIFNCVEKGWNVKKRDGKYIFQKSHDGKREVFMEDYLDKFIAENSSL